jgi:fermentation-respiration switch protein FrsA (DUF1100 family)
MSSMMISIVAVLFIAYLGLGLILYFMQSKFLYRPMREISYTPADLTLDFEDVTFKTADDLPLNGWYIPAADSGFTVLFCHGNGGNMMHRLDSISVFYNLGLSCFIFDYRGYGASAGKPTEEGTYLDAMAAYKWLTEQKKIPPGNIIIFGRSLGASIAAHLAGRVEAAALVIESAFTSYVDIGKKFYPYMPIRWFAKFGYSAIDYIREVTCPVMVIHSRADELMPFEFGLELYDAANQPKEFIELSGSHNDGFLVSGEIYKTGWTNWLKFLKEYKAKANPHHAS